MSDYSYIGHLLSSMVDRLAEVISNGDGVARKFLTDSVHNYSVRKLDSSFLRLLQSCRISLYVYIITFVHHFNRQ